MGATIAWLFSVNPSKRQGSDADGCVYPHAVVEPSQVRSFKFGARELELEAEPPFIFPFTSDSLFLSPRLRKPKLLSNHRNLPLVQTVESMVPF